MKHRIGWIGLALLGLAACQRQEPAAAPLAVPPPAEPVAAARPMVVPAEPPKAAPTPATAEERAKGIQACWGHFNAKDFPKLSDCYAENATSEQVDLGTPPLSGRQTIVERNTKVFASAFPDLTGETELTLVSGDDILSVVLLKGTHQGPLPGPQGEVAATNKKIGYLAVQHVVTSPDGRHIQKERFVYDGATFMSQLGLAPTTSRKALEQGWSEKPSLTSTGSDGEKANVAALAAYTAAFNQHDAPAIAATLTEDVVFSDMSSPADRVGKKEATKSAEELFKGFPDVRLEQTSAWAAGDYVVTAGRFSGTNTGDMPGMKLKKTGKAVSVEYYLVSRVAGGKLKNLWLFSNGLALAGQLGLLPPPKASKPGAAEKGPKPSAVGAPAAPHAPASPHAPPGARAPGAPPPAVAPKSPPAPASAPPPAAAAAKEARPVAPAPAPPPAAAPKPPSAPAAPPVPGGAR
jgi:predicted ester cyclase